jgi:hypothetical protein
VPRSRPGTALTAEGKVAADALSVGVGERHLIVLARSEGP